jgi:deoxyribodipyrimidine photo-lyase
LYLPGGSRNPMVMDRPWPERPIYGTILSMGRSGMERRAKADAYIREIGRLDRTGKEWTR